MSEALERVIAAQQKEIDWLKERETSHNKQVERVYKQLDDAFATINSTVNLRPKDWFKDKESHKAFYAHAHDLRMFLLDNSWCLSCESFNCECTEDD